MELSANTGFAQRTSPGERACPPVSTRSIVLVLLGFTAALPGCAAFHPLKGIPARYMPEEYEGESRSGKRTIDLSLLRQTPPDAYLLDRGDVLGVYIEGVLGNRDEAPPVHFPQDEEVAPSLGFPIPVREDGTISLPLVGAIDVRGMTVRQVEEHVRKEYTIGQQLLQPGRDRILISVLKPRTYQVLVIRQEQGGGMQGAGGGGSMLNLGALKRGSGSLVTLSAYKNDVLHALAETGGLPGLDAENTIYVIRSDRSKRNARPAPVDGHSPVLQPVGPTLSRFHGTTPSQGVAPPAYSTGRQSPAPPIRQVAHTEYTSYRSGVQPAIAYRSPNGPSHVQPVNGTVAPYANGYAPSGPNGTPQSIPSSRYGNNWSYPQAPYPPTAAPQYSAGQYGTGGDGYSPYTVPETSWPEPVRNLTATVDNARVVKIPVRLHDGDVVNLTENDVILEDGDIVFIESRETEIYYTGGLLGGGQYTLPRDYDLDVIGAISIAQSRTGGGGGSRSSGGPSALNQDVDVSASNVIVLRQLDNGTQLPIKVNLYEALRNPAERILIQPRDIVILQYTPVEAVAAFVERHLLEGALFGLAASQLQTGNGN